MSVAERQAPLDPDAEESGRLARRLRVAVTLCLGPIIVFALFDLALQPHAALPLFWALKLGALLVIAVAAMLLREDGGRRPRARGTVIGIGLTCVAAMYALSTASAMLAHEGQTTMLMTLAVALATATLLPWGVGPQVAVVAIGALSTVITIYGAHGDLHALGQYPMVGMVVGLGVSIYVAAEFQRGRDALARRLREQRAAEAEVRRLNDGLEERVAARTAELRRSQAAVGAVIENATDAIWAVDRDAQLILSNAALRQRVVDIYGFELPPDGAYPADVLAALTAYWMPLYVRGLAGERFSVEQTVAQAGGTRSYVNAFNPITVDGAVIGLAVFSADVTQQRRAEAEARQHQAELTRVLRLSTMGEMAAGLAHEINQPLAAIVNYAQGCGRRLRANPGDVGTVLPVIDVISAEALRAGEIIRRLRRLIRREAPRQEWLDLNDLVREALSIVEPDARQDAVAVSLDLQVALPPLRGDGIQIEQVVLNLLRNAVEAMHDSSGRRALWVSTHVRDAATVQLEVRDSGPGVAAEFAAQVFEPFYSTKPAGLGMGLSISRTIIESHGGRIEFAANAEGGAIFRVTLPIAAAPATVATAAE